MLQVKIVLSFYQIVTQIQPVYGIVMPANVRDTPEMRPRCTRDTLRSSQARTALPQVNTFLASMQTLSLDLDAFPSLRLACLGWRGYTGR